MRFMAELQHQMEEEVQQLWQYIPEEGHVQMQQNALSNQAVRALFQDTEVLECTL